jgi:hypothetical protein
MKHIFMVGIFSLLFFGCSSKNPPISDVESAKIAFLKLKSESSNSFMKSDIQKIENKIKYIEKLMEEKKYDKAQSNALKVKSDSEYLSKKIKNKKLSEEIKILQSEINRITNSFTTIKSEEE